MMSSFIIFAVFGVGVIFCISSYCEYASCNIFALLFLCRPEPWNYDA